MNGVVVVIPSFAILAFFLFGGYGQGREEKVCNRKTNLIIKMNNTCYHIHHWLIFLILGTFLMVYLVNNNNNTYVLCALGFCFGAIIQGLTYRDAFQFICSQCPS